MRSGNLGVESQDLTSSYNEAKSFSPEAINRSNIKAAIDQYTASRSRLKNFFVGVSTDQKKLRDFYKKLAKKSHDFLSEKERIQLCWVLLEIKKSVHADSTTANTLHLFFDAFEPFMHILEVWCEKNKATDIPIAYLLYWNKSEAIEVVKAMKLINTRGVLVKRHLEIFCASPGWAVRLASEMNRPERVVKNSHHVVNQKATMAKKVKQEKQILPVVKEKSQQDAVGVRAALINYARQSRLTAPMQKSVDVGDVLIEERKSRLQQF
jgi:hypothetical protein